MATQVYSYLKQGIFILILMMLACSPKKQAEEISESAYITEDVEGLNEEEEFLLGFDINNYLVDFEPDSSESLILRQNCAIFIGPNEEQLESLKRRFGQQEFSTIVEDNIIFEVGAKEMIRSLNICSVSTQKRYIVFIRPDETKLIIDTKSPHSLKWNLIFFHFNKAPEIVDIPELELEDIRLYFQS
ncbi:MAG TPA: hypothetical protein PKC24_09685 [Cyclobacteriaceae bacterium]|nr:hypothetical protein [Cyclobacteriaceae bacterium]